MLAKSEEYAYNSICESACQFSGGIQCFAQIAQLVEQRTENPRVTGSIPVLGTICGRSSMVEH